MEGRKFYLLDPAQAAFRAVEVPILGIEVITTYLGCMTADSIRFDESHLVFFDDDGLHDGISHYTTIEGYPNPLGGKLILAAEYYLVGSEPLMSIEQALPRFRCYRPVMDPIIEKSCISDGDLVRFVSTISGFRTRIEPVDIRILK